MSEQNSEHVEIIEPASLGGVFGMLSHAEIRQRLSNFTGNRTVKRIDGPKAPTSAATAAFDKAIDDEPFVDVEDAPQPETGVTAEVFQEAAASVASSEKSPSALPDLTNAYLNQLIGWNRQRTGLNPRANLQVVWVKDRHDQWQESETESWPAISQAIIKRERNVETAETTLLAHIRSLRVEISPQIVNQLLNWYYEKTGRDHKKNETVWIKTASGEWDMAMYRWSDVDAEFRHEDVRARMGAKDLQHYKHKLRTEAIDRIVLGSGVQP